MTDDLTLTYPTVALCPTSLHRAAVLRACQEANALPWWAFRRRGGWITTARHIKRLEAIGVRP